jgi:hypothetical protein
LRLIPWETLAKTLKKGAKTLTVSNGSYHEPIAPDKLSIRSSSLCPSNG